MTPCNAFIYNYSLPGSPVNSNVTQRGKLSTEHCQNF